MAERQFNFSAGPGVLPESVLTEIASELPVYKDIGTSILEISHRSAPYTELVESAKSSLRQLLGMEDDWHILFLQGGASLQFYQVPLNFLPKDGSADYIVTGSWAKKAHKEALFVGDARVAASSEADSFSHIPDRATWNLNPDAAYLHYTSNNTIFGTQFKDVPDVSVPLVCDASSDFLSKPIRMDGFGLIYAGAQKNMGPAGVTIVIIRDDLVSRSGVRKASLPTMLSYAVHAENKSLYNTPAVFAIYAVGLVMKWLSAQGGLSVMGKRNERKAGKLYAEIDRTGFYRGTARKEDRSLMNVTFRLSSEALEKLLIKEATAAGLDGLEGHRAVGGLRASLYNAFPEEGVDELVAFMKEFERRNG